MEGGAHKAIEFRFLVSSSLVHCFLFLCAGEGTLKKNNVNLLMDLGVVGADKKRELI